MTPQERDKLIYRSWRVYIQLSEVQVSFEASMDFRAPELNDVMTIAYAMFPRAFRLQFEELPICPAR